LGKVEKNLDWVKKTKIGAKHNFLKKKKQKKKKKEKRKS